MIQRTMRIPAAKHTRQSRLFNELSTLIFSLLQSSTDPASSSQRLSSSSSYRLPSSTRISPAEFASLMLGISLALMLCGSVTFIIGFMLMPWVIGLVMVLYIVGLVTGISMLARALIFHISALASPPPKHLPDWKLLEQESSKLASIPIN